MTNSRAIIKAGLLGSARVQTLELRNLPQINLTEHPGGFGTITFGPVQPFLQPAVGKSNWDRPGVESAVPTFESIPNAEKVYALVREGAGRPIPAA